MVRVILIFFTVPKQEINVSWRILTLCYFIHVERERERKRGQQRNSKKKMKWSKFQTNIQTEWILRSFRTKAVCRNEPKKTESTDSLLEHCHIEASRQTEWRQKKKSELQWQWSAIIYCFKCILCNFMTFCCGNKTSTDDQCGQQPQRTIQPFQKDIEEKHVSKSPHK